MRQDTKIITLIYGNDEYAISRDVKRIIEIIEDPSLREANTSNLDGRDFNPLELLSVTNVMPFLAEKRVVIFRNPLAKLEPSKDPEKKPDADTRKRYKEKQKKFLELLEQVADTTNLLLIVYDLLKPTGRKPKIKKHWLVEWAEAHPNLVGVKKATLEKGSSFVATVQNMTTKAGGKITDDAARLLAELAGGDPRQADQEIKKLLTYVGKERPIEEKDVLYLTPDASVADVFKMVDALGYRNGGRALNLLQRLLEQQAPKLVFGMVVRQFRMLLLTRETLDNRGGRNEIIAALGIYGARAFIADKLIPQARRFSLSELEGLYRQLLELDTAVKFSEITTRLALETFIIQVTASKPAVSRRR
jgi:DNA polymerase-3 subunit delta